MQAPKILVGLKVDLFGVDPRAIYVFPISTGIYGVCVSLITPGFVAFLEKIFSANLRSFRKDFRYQ